MLLQLFELSNYSNSLRYSNATRIVFLERVITRYSVRPIFTTNRYSVFNSFQNLLFVLTLSQVHLGSSLQWRMIWLSLWWGPIPSPRIRGQSSRSRDSLRARSWETRSVPGSRTASIWRKSHFPSQWEGIPREVKDLPPGSRKVLEARGWALEVVRDQGLPLDLWSQLQ